MKKENNLGVEEFIILLVGIVAIVQVKVIPQVEAFILRLKEFGLYLITGWRISAVIAIIVLPVLLYVQYKISLDNFNRCAQIAKQEETADKKRREENERRVLEEEIHQARIKKNEKRARELSRKQRWMKGDFSDEGEGIKPALKYEEKRVEEIKKPKQRVVEIEVDLKKNFYKRKEINKHEVEYLLKKGYEEIKHRSISTGREENFIIRPRFNESLKHAVIIYDIADYLDENFAEYELFTTRMPDIVIKGEHDFALEVETGTVLNNLSKFEVKLSQLKENFGKNWAFIVTNRNIIKKYKKFGKVIDPRFIRFNIDKILEKC